MTKLTKKYKEIVSYVKSKNNKGELIEKKPKCKLCDCYRRRLKMSR
jgi:hypothetical protein